MYEVPLARWIELPVVCVLTTGTLTSTEFSLWELSGDRGNLALHRVACYGCACCCCCCGDYWFLESINLVRCYLPDSTQRRQEKKGRAEAGKWGEGEGVFVLRW